MNDMNSLQQAMMMRGMGGQPMMAGGQTQPSPEQMQALLPLLMALMARGGGMNDGSGPMMPSGPGGPPSGPMPPIMGPGRGYGMG